MPTLPQAIAEAGGSMNETQRKKQQLYEREKQQAKKDAEELSDYGKAVMASVRNTRFTVRSMSQRKRKVGK